MQTLLIVLLCLFTAAAAPARDSLCLFGDDGKIAVAVFEHRIGAGDRATEITLIYGGYVLRGRLKDVDAGPVTLKDVTPGPNAYSFSGRISIDFATRRITLKGRLKTPPGNDGIEIDASFEGRELRS